MSRKYKFYEKNGAYFVSFATVNWIDVFTRDIYFAIMTESLDHCRKNKGMEIYGYCIMPSHVHLIFRSSLGDPSGLMRDLKGFTSRKLLKTIEDNPQESRREWMLWMFERAGMKNSNVKGKQFWQYGNHAEEIYTQEFMWSKLDYIYLNPVRAGIVEKASEYIYSSASNYVYGKGIVEVVCYAV